MISSLGTDLRSLALFRVALGCILLARSVSGLHDVFAGEAPGWSLAPHALAAGTVIFDGLVALSALSAACVVLGYRTRAALAIHWLLLVSLYLSFPGGVQASHTVMAAQTFLALCLPLNAFWSVDAALDRAPPDNTRITTLPAAVLVTLGVLCLFVPSLLAFADAARPPSQDAWHMTAYGVGLAVPVLAFLPLWTPVLRLVAMVVSAGVVLVAGPGPAVLPVLAGLLPLTPPAIWNRFARSPGGRRRSGLAIYYDRDCGFCLKTCLLFRTFFALGPVPVAPAQDTPDMYRIMEQHDSWVVRDHDGETYIRWHAVLLLLWRSPIFWPLGWCLTAIGMGRWADGLYGLIGHNRWLFSRLTKHVLPYRPVAVETSRAGTVAAAAWVLLLVLANFARLDALPPDLADILAWAGNGLGLVTDWRALL